VYHAPQVGTVLGNAADVPLPAAAPQNPDFARLGMFPLPGVRARIAPQAADRADLGELVLRTDHVAEQRRNAIAGPMAMIRGGEYWTGDLARRDSDGSVRVLGPLRAPQSSPDTDAHADAHRPALRYRKHGDFGPALVFIPGAGTTARFFDRAVAALSADHTVVTVDLPGHGLSARVPADEQPPADVPGVARALHAVIADLGLEDVTLVGWALGASVAFRYVEQYGTERVRSLISIEYNPCLLAEGGWPHAALGGINARGARELLESLKHAGDDVAANLVRGSFAPGAAPDPLLLCDLIADAQDCNPAAVRTLLADAFAQDRREGAARIKVPTLLVHGAHSALCPPAVGGWLADVLPDAQLSVFEDSGHLPFVEQPDRFAAEARGFVARTGARR
ncbi:MAG: alpha/beta fold hydrolase, partial [Actinocrinis sp.]